MSTRLRERFEQGKAAGRPLFVGYVTAGFPERADMLFAKAEVVAKNKYDMLVRQKELYDDK